MFGKDPVSIANEANENINNPEPDISSNLDTHHKIPLTDEEKQEKAMKMIDEIVEEKLKPIEAQLKELPGLVHNTVMELLKNLNQQVQQNTQQPQQQGGQPNNMEAIATLVQAVAPIFGKSEAQNPLMDMIIQSYMKRMQMDIDSQFMSTYQTPVNPPTWQKQQIKSKIDVE